MKKVFLALLVVALVSASFALVACGGEETTETTTAASTPVEVTTLHLQGAFPEGGAHYYYLETFQEKVKEYSNGTLEVVWGAGPEAIPANELGEALKNDSVELVFTPYSYLVSFMPVMQAVKLFDAETARANGGDDYINELSEAGLNAHFLARCSDAVPFVIATNFEVTSLDDFKGKTFRGTAAQQPLLEGLGAAVTSMPLGDIYDAIERNVIEGTGCVLTDITDNSLQDVLKYLIQPGFYNSDSSLIVAMGTWNKLTAEQQDALTQAAIDWEVDSKIHNTEMNTEAIATMTAAGMQVIELQGAMRDTWLKTAYDEVWKATEAADAEVAAKMKTFVQ